MKKVFSILGMCAGIIVTLLGVNIYNDEVYKYLPDYSFGADFYTEMYSITRDTATTVISMANTLNRALAILVISVGIVSFCYFGIEVGKAFSKETDSQVALPQPHVKNNQVRVQRDDFTYRKQADDITLDDYDFIKLDK